MAFGSRSATLLAPAITVLIVSAGAFAPSTAHAECGNYVVYTNGPPSSADPNPMPDHAPKPTPCHGPGCSQAPTPAPAPQAPPKLRILADEWLSASTGVASAVPNSDPSPIESAAGKPTRRSVDVYHPPR